MQFFLTYFKFYYNMLWDSIKKSTIFEIVKFVKNICSV
jgi:hypothetical protein